jgi:hypothetical protein
MRSGARIDLRRRSPCSRDAPRLNPRRSPVPGNSIDMTLPRSSFALVGVLAVSCIGCDKLHSVGSTADDGVGQIDAEPWRDAWRLVVDQPFPVLDDDGALAIGTLQIGGIEENGNFANRGDVIVRYADTPRITVEMRRFTMASNETTAEEDFDALQIWAYAGSGSPAAPEDMNEDDNCRDPNRSNAWRDGCRVRVYYSGQIQLARAGADLRVTLPRGWHGDLEVTTEDNDADSDYHNRGNVCVEGLAGNADIALGSGRAFVTLADDILETPQCPMSDVAACDAVGWDPTACPCLAGSTPFGFGMTKIASHAGRASDMVIDLPPALWSSVSLTNAGASQTTEPGSNACVDSEGACCDAVVDPSVGAFEIEETTIGTEETRRPWINRGEVNVPSPAATRGGGYGVRLESAECQAITTTEDPTDFVGEGNGPDQPTTELGNLTVCSGCLRTQSCDDLLPGG